MVKLILRDSEHYKRVVLTLRLSEEVARDE